MFGVTLLSFGEMLFDVYPDRACIGGAPLNYAAHVVRHGGEAQMVSAVGNDRLGNDALAQLDAWGIGTAYVTVYEDKPTGTCDVTLNEQAIPTYRLATDTAWDAIDTDRIRDGADVLYFGTLALRSPRNREALSALLARCRFGEVFVDLNLRAPFYDEQVIRSTLRHATLLKLSDEELPVVASLLGIEPCDEIEQLARAIAAHADALRVLIVTCGAQGACALNTGDGRFVRVPAVPATVVSTVGAGDSFSAAFTARYVAGEPLEACLRHAAEIASLVVSHTEAIPEYIP